MVSGFESGAVRMSVCLPKCSRDARKVPTYLVEQLFACGVGLDGKLQLGIHGGHPNVDLRSIENIRSSQNRSPVGTTLPPPRPTPTDSGAAYDADSEL